MPQLQLSGLVNMSGNIHVGNNVDPKMASIDAVIIRADGTRVNLGTIAYYHKNPLKRLWWKIKRFIKGVL